jgi:hypothetical protein
MEMITAICTKLHMASTVHMHVFMFVCVCPRWAITRGDGCPSANEGAERLQSGNVAYTDLFINLRVITKLLRPYCKKNNNYVNIHVRTTNEGLCTEIKVNIRIKLSL